LLSIFREGNVKTRTSRFALTLASRFLVGLLVYPWVSTGPVLAANPPVVIDDFETGLAAGRDGGNNPIGFYTFQDGNAGTTVAISTSSTPPAPVPGTSASNNVLKLDVSVVSYAGLVHAFENSAVNTWVSQDWSAYEGISFWLYGRNSGTTLFVDVLDNRSAGSTRDDAERWSVDVPDTFLGWREIKIPFASMHRKDVGNGAPNDGFGLTEVHGWALGAVTTPSPQTYYVDQVMLYGVAPVRPLTVGFTGSDYSVTEGATATITAKLSKPSSTSVTVHYATTFGPAIPKRDYAPVMGTLTFPPNVTQQSFTVQTIGDHKYQGVRGVLVELSKPTSGAVLGVPAIARLAILDDEAFDPSLLDDFETYPYLWRASREASLSNPEIAAGDPLARPGQGAYEHVLQVGREHGDHDKDDDGGYEVSRAFPIGQDWSDAEGLSFWVYGRGSDRNVDVNLTNRAARDDRPRLKLVWSDEFDDKAGTALDPGTWGQEIGDGTVGGNPGWGNSELEYYTGGKSNVSTDGRGHLRITIGKADGSLMCYYGPCQYTSARLLTKNRFEVAYGRVEARIKVPTGSGLWPAFWMLGTDIDQVGWPQTGEIDIMENVGRLPSQVFGTLHGPGYSGGQSYGKTDDLGAPVADDYHVFAVDWQPGKITWTVDGVPYFTATPADAFLQGKQWVFDHPFFLLMNVAVGGNFGGSVGPETTFPQTMSVDYVRLYQAQPELVSFRASFRDDFSGWKRISIPFSAFRSHEGRREEDGERKREGARPKLDLSAVQSVGFEVPEDRRGPLFLDQIRLDAPNDVTVTSTADGGAGSLRKALGVVAVDGTVHLSAVLAGQKITLLSGPLTLAKNVTIDGSAAPGLTISGNHSDRVFIVNAGTTATVSALTVADGYGWQLAGGILNNGSLTLDHVVVTGNTMATDAGDFWQGGGGIYTGGGATLNLIDSSVTNNQARWSGGGLYSYFNTTTTIVRSTISGNVSNDVGGGFRSLGNVSITNSTLSGNTSTGWHGGAIFHTNGAMEIGSSTIANNIGPDFAPSAIFLGSFDATVPSLKLTNTIITGNQWYACEQHAAGQVSLTSGGHNLVQDGSCSPAASDQVVGDARIGPLANNGGPTLTHALLPDSPALDAGDDTACPATDQRGVARPQGAHCDIGSYEGP
jgi:beta-glucanase (GH16 family)